MSEPLAKRRKIADESPTSDLPALTAAPIDLTGLSPESDDDDLIVAIRMSLEGSTTSSSAAPAPPYRPSALEELRILQRQKYEQHHRSTSTPAPAGSSGTGVKDPSHLNLAGRTVFLNKLAGAHSDDCLDIRDIICKGSLVSGIIGGVFDDAIQELLYFFPQTTPLLLCTKPIVNKNGVPSGSLSAPSAWKFAYSAALVHAKFMILFFPQYLRLVIASGNFTQLEYEKIRQVIWYQDFPKRVTTSSGQTTHPFVLKLSQFLLALNVPQSSVDQINCFEFSEVKATLITSIPTNEAKIAPVSGLTQLRHFTSTLPPLSDEASIVVQTNTVSMASEAWLKEFVEACGRKGRSGAPKMAADKLKVVYPTEKVFSASDIGGDAFSVVLFKSIIPQNRFFVCLDVEGSGTLLHSKIIYPESGSWMYVGSHNLTKSAWGSSKVNATNFELGIVFLKDSWKIRMPFSVPLQNYGPTDALGGVIRNWDPAK
eukprot:TRINITY_DN1285_c0_g1_i3.p1 TRINITY_DN1285_c0_g1~~TRINITY_DN1285_c0_g1_i3.p1  ORF type:complete len:483 (-),score=66.60 TRINITY_DN1285_c0_g1_i3:904-2352(-)